MRPLPDRAPVTAALLMRETHAFWRMLPMAIQKLGPKEVMKWTRLVAIRTPICPHLGLRVVPAEQLGLLTDVLGR